MIQRIVILGASIIASMAATAHALVAGTVTQIRVSNVASPQTMPADDLWQRVLRALNENHASITKERLEKILGVKLVVRRLESDGTTYLTDETHGGDLEARLTVYNAKFKSVAGPALNGAHLNWYVGWERGKLNGKCITAERVRTSLLASGWTSPWSDWGVWERPWVTPNDPFYRTYPPIKPAPIASFHRKEADTAEQHDSLPRGEVLSTGDMPDSCVTGILIDAAL